MRWERREDAWQLLLMTSSHAEPRNSYTKGQAPTQPEKSPVLLLEAPVPTEIGV